MSDRGCLEIRKKGLGQTCIRWLLSTLLDLLRLRLYLALIPRVVSRDEFPILGSSVPLDVLLHTLLCLPIFGRLGTLCRFLCPFELYKAMQVATQALALCKLVCGLLLDALLTFSDVVKTGECAVDIRVDVFPGLHVETWVHLGDLTYYDPVPELCDFLVWLVGIVLEAWGRLEAYRTHVVVPAVVDVGFLLILEAFLQLLECCLRVYPMRRALPVQLEGDAGLARCAVVLVEQVEPQDQGVIARERAKRNPIVGRFEPKHLQCLLGGDRLPASGSQARIKEVPARDKGRNPARFRVLGSCHAEPPPLIHDLPLSHLFLSYCQISRDFSDDKLCVVCKDVLVLQVLVHVVYRVVLVLPLARNSFLLPFLALASPSVTLEGRAEVHYDVEVLFFRLGLWSCSIWGGHTFLFLLS